MDAAAEAAAQGDFRTAERHLKRAVELQELTLGPQHPDVANTLNNLGVVYEHLEETARRAVVSTRLRHCARRASGRRSVSRVERKKSSRLLRGPRHSVRTASNRTSGGGASMAPAPPSAAKPPAAAPAAPPRAAPTALPVPPSQPVPPTAPRTPAPVRPATPPPAVARPLPRQPTAPPAAVTRNDGIIAVTWSDDHGGPDRADCHRGSCCVPETTATESRSSAHAGSEHALSVSHAPASQPARPEPPAPQPAEPVSPPAVATPPAPTPTPAATCPPAAAAPAAPKPRESSTGHSGSTAPTPSVVTAQLCRTLDTAAEWRCTPVTGSLEPGAVFFFTRLKCPSDTTVEHRWYLNNRLRQTMTLHVRANQDRGYRTYSRTTIGANGSGDWRVELRAPDGTVLREERFTVGRRSVRTAKRGARCPH